MSTTTYVTYLPDCDLCGLTAEYDAKTIDGPWASLCLGHFGALGIGLGAGLGQRLIVGKEPERDRAKEVHAAVRAGDWAALEDAIGDGDIADYL